MAVNLTALVLGLSKIGLAPKKRRIFTFDYVLGIDFSPPSEEPHGTHVGKISSEHRVGLRGMLSALETGAPVLANNRAYGALAYRASKRRASHAEIDSVELVGPIWNMKYKVTVDLYRD